MARGAAGLDFALDVKARHPVGLGARVDWLRSFGADGFEPTNAPGTEVRPFGDLVLLSLVMQSEF